MHKQASAYTTERVTGNMQVLNWNLYKTKWKHLECIKFPQVGPRPIVDLLIGVDQADLLYSLEDVRGRPGEPIARLTPLGWTCIGNPELQASQAQTNFTFLVKDSHELNNLVRRFWDVDDSKEIQIVKPVEKIARGMVAETLTFEDGHYSVGLPWKTKDHDLPDNFTMATQWPCTICKTQRNDFRNPQNLPRLTAMYLKRTKIKDTSVRSYQRKKRRIKYGIYHTFQF